MIADRFRGLVQSSAARQRTFEQAQANARIGEVQRAHDDLMGAAHELGASTNPLSVCSAALFELAAREIRGCSDVSEFDDWAAKAVQGARAVLLGDRGQK